MNDMPANYGECDHTGCNANSYVRVILTTGELHFCGHHAKLMRAGLEPKCLLWLDEQLVAIGKWESERHVPAEVDA